MKKSCFILILGLFLSINYAHAEGGTIAVVDLQKIVSNSAQVKQLKQEHAKKMDELNKIIVNARGEISNETDSAKILQLEEKYTKEFNTKNLNKSVFLPFNKKTFNKVFNPFIDEIEKILININEKRFLQDKIQMERLFRQLWE